MRLKVRSSVVLPLPLSPTRATVSPGLDGERHARRARPCRRPRSWRLRPLRGWARGARGIVYPGVLRSASMKSEHLRFPGARGHELAARLESPAGDARRLRPLRPLLHLLEGPQGRGLDHPGSRRSGGSPCCASTSPASARAKGSSRPTASPRTWRIWWRRRTSCAASARRRACWSGTAWAGCAVLAAAQRIPEARAVATIAAPSDTEHLRSAGRGSPRSSRRAARPRSTSAARPVPRPPRAAGRPGGGSPAGVARQASTGRSSSSTRRWTTPSASSTPARLFEVAKHPKSFISLDDARTTCSDPRAGRPLRRRRAGGLGRAATWKG